MTIGKPDSSQLNGLRQNVETPAAANPAEMEFPGLQAAEALLFSEERFRQIAESADEWIWEVDAQGLYTYTSSIVEKILGYNADELVGKKHFYDLFAPSVRDELKAISITAMARKQPIRRFENPNVHQDGHIVILETNGLPIVDDQGNLLGYRGADMDITERKQAENRERLARDILSCLNRSDDVAESIRYILFLIKQCTGLEAVAIRLRKGDDFPYYQTYGFSKHFLQTASGLHVRDETGMVFRDAQGNPQLDCLCGKVIRGQANLARPFYTHDGSFWCNRQADLLAATAELDTHDRTCHRCHRAGHESVALIPLRSNNDIIGLLQFNDHRRDQFTLEMIRFFEGVGMSIGIALSRAQAEKALRASEEHFRAVADHMYDWEYWIAPDGRLLYMSPSCERITGHTASEFLEEPRLLLRIIHPHDASQHSAHRHFIEESDSDPTEFDFRIVAKNGDAHWIAHCCRAVFGDDGRYLGRRVSNRDVTGRKQAEAGLRSQHAIFEGILESASSAIFSVDRDYCYTSFNRIHADFMHALYGAVIEVGKSFLSYMTCPQDQDAAKKSLDRALTGERYTERVESAADHLSHRHFEVTHCPIINPDGTCSGVAVFASDITEQSQAENALRNAHELNRSITDTAQDAILMMNPQGNISFWNRAAERIFGYSREEVFGRNLNELLVSDGHHAARHAALTDFWKTGTGSAVGKILEMNARRKDGQEICVDLSLSTVQIGEEWYTVGILRDITERKRAAESVRFAAEYNRSLIEASLDPLVTIGQDGRISDVNKATEEATGFSRGDLIGSDFCNYFTEPDQARLGYERIFREGTVRDFPLEMRHRNGQITSVLYNASVYRNDAGEVLGVFAAARDISDRKQAEQERETLEAQLRQSQRLETIGTLAGGIAHDFNNILVPILISTSMLLDQNKENETICEDLQEINTAALRARDLVRHILTFSRQNEGDQIHMDLSPLVKEVAKLCAASFPSTIAFDYQIHCQGKCVLADPTQIYQVLMNLCTNAGHAIGEIPGRITVTLECRLVNETTAAKHPALRVGEYVVMSVEDSGEGIDAAILDRIFEPFFTTKEVGKGTGLGLSVVHGIVKSHNGDILVKTRKGSGTTVSVYLPVTNAVEEAPVEKKSGARNGAEHILLIDDEPVIVRAGKKALERYGYHVTTAGGSFEAMKTFVVQPADFDLVVTDQTMPQMTGDQLLKALREIHPDIPVILMTGFSTKITADNFADFGFNGYVQKPMIPRQLNAAIRSVLDRDGRSLPGQSVGPIPSHSEEISHA